MGVTRNDLEDLIDQTAGAIKALLVDGSGMDMSDVTANALKNLLVDSAGVHTTDATANAIREFLVNAAGTAIGSVPIHGETALLTTDRPHSDDVFFGFGEHDVVGATDNVDIWGGAADTQPEPVPAGYGLFVVSSSAADDGAPVGTGAQQIVIHYLDTAGAQQELAGVILNGTTEVDTGVTDCMFVQQAHVTAVGSGLVAAGNIDCLAGTGGAVVTRIAALGNQSMSTMKQVPAGKNLIVVGRHAYATAATTKIANVRLRSTGHEGANNPGVYNFHDAARLKDTSTGHIPLQFLCPPLSTVKISAWTTGTISLTARWQGWLENV